MCELVKYWYRQLNLNSIQIKMKFSNKIGKQLSEYFSKDKITLLEDGSYLVENSFPNDEGLKKFILSFGDEGEVLAPEEFRKEMQNYIKKIYSKYTD